MSSNVQSFACLCLLRAGIENMSIVFELFPQQNASFHRLLYAKRPQGGSRVCVIVFPISTPKWQSNIFFWNIYLDLCVIDSKENWKTWTSNIFRVSSCCKNMREHRENLLTNKKQIKSDMDPKKICVAAVWSASWWKGSSWFEEWKEEKKREKNTHVSTPTDLCRYWYIFMHFTHIVRCLSHAYDP